MLGRLLVGTGVLILLFALFQLFGTGISAAKSQAALRRQFAHEQLAPQRPAATPTSSLPAGSPPTTALGPPPPPEGDAVAIIRIPKIGVDKAVVQGVGESDLRQGPGHYPSTPLPGQPGNSAIAGHRTTYGAPFYRLNELAGGDTIFVTTRQGAFYYRVQRSMVVDPSDVSVIDPQPGANLLTLTTCNPRFSATQRLVVQASLVGPAAPASPLPSAGSGPAQSGATSGAAGPGGAGSDASASAASLAGGQGGWLASLVWGVILILAVVAVWMAAQLWRRRRQSRGWLAYLAGTPLLVIVLYFFFENVSVLLPASI